MPVYLNENVEAVPRFNLFIKLYLYFLFSFNFCVFFLNRSPGVMVNLFHLGLFMTPLVKPSVDSQVPRMPVIGLFESMVQLEKSSPLECVGRLSTTMMQMKDQVHSLMITRNQMIRKSMKKSYHLIIVS
jgi:hypothetical protein